MVDVTGPMDHDRGKVPTAIDIAKPKPLSFKMANADEGPRSCFVVV